MKTRYYDIKHINTKQIGHKKAAIIIVACALVLCLVLGLGSSIIAKTALKEAGSSGDVTTSEQHESMHLGDTLRQRTVSAVIDGESINAMSRDEIYNMDLSVPSGVTVADLKLCTKGNLVGLEEDFWQLEQEYDINCLFVMAIASHESANGTICFRKNNMFGFGTKGFSSKAEGIRVVGKTLANSYLSPNGRLYKGKTVEAVHKRYAASPTWDDKVVRNMVRYYSIISENHNKGIDALK